MLDIRTYRSHLGLRVDIHRKYKSVDAQTGKAKYHFRQIGSFPLNQGYDQTLLTLIDDSEVLQLENWLADSHFGHAWKKEADELVKLSLKVPPQLPDVMHKLFIEAKRLGIHFVPDEIMLNGLMNKAALIEAKIDKINGFSSGILTAYQPTHHKTDEEIKQALADGKAVYQRLLAMTQPASKTCEELNTAAARLGKSLKMPLDRLKEWAGQRPKGGKNSQFKSWYYTIGIDVLLAHDINPCELIPPARLIKYWIAPQKEVLTSEQAIETCLTAFARYSITQKMVEEVIDEVYVK
ncbi:MAG: hypothetical protein HKM04_03925 [Legionellales bacterium]|nr:hypothetical protein [Legionellales bacterium]